LFVLVAIVHFFVVKQVSVFGYGFTPGVLDDYLYRVAVRFIACGNEPGKHCFKVQCFGLRLFE